MNTVTVTPEVFESILDQIREGLSMVAICRGYGMPARSTFYRFLEGDTEAQDRYARACEARQELLFEEILTIADTPQRGEKRKIMVTDEQEADEGQVVEVTESDMTEHRKLQIEARKWVLGKMNPKKYGNNVDLNLQGAAPVSKVTVEFVTGGDSASDD